jgi:peptidyl-prolyl cis-trans isomerase SurA
MDELKQKVKSDPRVIIARKRMLQTILKRTQFREHVPGGNALWSFTDSLLKGKKPEANIGIDNSTILFEFRDAKYTVGDWIAYRKSLRSFPSRINGKTNDDILESYLQTVAFDYYKRHLEEYNQEFAAQINDFRDGNLLFEIMQKKIWSAASVDSEGIKKYFEERSKKYWWKPNAAAIIFTAPSQSSAEQLEMAAATRPGAWRKLVDSLGNQLQADSGRFEWQQIPGKVHPVAGRFTDFVSLPDKSAQFAYIVKGYPNPYPRSFEEARGLVINDYQKELEDRWIAELKKKYPVVVYESVLKSLPK